MLRSTKFSMGFMPCLIIVGCAAFSQTIRPELIIDTNSTASVFAPGVVSTPFEEAAATFTPDGKTVYFYQGTVCMTVCSSTFANGKWTKPEVVPFSGLWSDWDPFLSPDGKRLFFVSNRPLEDASPGKSKKKSHLWYADHFSGDRWSSPHLLQAAFNLDSVNNFAPSVSSTGTLFFCSNGRDGHKGMGSYYAKQLGDHYDSPKLLTLNGAEETQDPFIAPDESYIILVSGNDLYISFRKGDVWSAGQKLGPQVNNGDAIWDPTVSPDGKMLYYTSARIKGFFTRNRQGPALNYDGLLTEMGNIFNGRGNILMIPIHLPKTNN
jgi:Tol biopolymer transport system component